MKICIYAICKNEIKYIQRWLDSVKQADEVVVVDTGSTDGTWELLQQQPNIKAYQQIFTPFRFDAARNYALSLVSQDCDICLALDIDSWLDQEFCKSVKENWQKNVGVMYIPRAYYNSNHVDKWFVHKRQGVKWIYPVYEQLKYTGATVYYDNTKIYTVWDIYRPSHQMYLELAKLGVQENPQDEYCLQALELIKQEAKKGKDKK